MQSVTETNGKAKNSKAGASNVERVERVACADVTPFKMQARSVFDGINELASQMKAHGQIEPIIVRRNGNEPGYELVDGERRLRAAKLNGWLHIDAIVRDLSDEAAFDQSVMSNIARASLHPLDEAAAYRVQMTRFHRTIDQIAEKYAAPTKYIVRRLRLDEVLVEDAKEAFRAGTLTLGKAEAIATIPVADMQRDALAFASKKNYRGELPSLGELEEQIRSRFRLPLFDAPFDRTDAQLVAGVPACTGCPKRTGNQRELFDGAKGKELDVCTDPLCYREKANAGWARKTAEAESKGARVLTDKEAKKLYPHGSHYLSSSDYIELDRDCHEAPKPKTYRALLGKDAPPVTLARTDDGKVHELVRRSEAQKVLAEKHEWAKQASRSSSSSSKASQADKAKREKEKIRSETRLRALERIVAAASSREANEGFYRFVARGVLREVWHDTLKTIASRRRLIDESDKKQRTDLSKVLEKHVATLVAGDLRAFIVELLCARSLHDTYASEKSLIDDACALYKVDLKKLEAEVKAERAAPRAAKAKESAKPARKGARPGKKAKEVPAGTCRACGCCDDDACLGADGAPCSWVEPNLCSECSPGCSAAPAKETKKATSPKRGKGRG
jgi:ParB/RepB/Spo0J family partition protein